MNKLSKLTAKIYAAHIMIALVSLIAAFPLFNFIQKHPHFYSAITSFVCLFSVYSVAWHKGARDSRNIPGSYPDKSVPVKLSLYSSVIPVVLLLTYLVVPNALPCDLPFLSGNYDFLFPGCKIFGTPDFIYRLWYFAYAGFIPSGNIALYIIEILIEPAIIFAGYNIGLKRYSFLELFYKKVVLVNKKPKGKTKRRK